MIEKDFKIKNKLGLHARPAALFVQLTTRFKSQIKVVKDGQEADGKSIMGLMLMAAENGSSIRVRAHGPDEMEAVAAIGDLFDRKFDEE